MTHQTTHPPVSSAIVASAPPPSVMAITGEPAAEEATDADPVDGSATQPGPHPPAGAGRPDPDPQSPFARGAASSARARDARRGHRALVRAPALRCARCGRRGCFVRLATLA